MISLTHTLIVFAFVAFYTSNVECQLEEFYRFLQEKSEPKWYSIGPIADIRTLLEPTKSSEETGSGEEKTVSSEAMESVEPTIDETPMCLQKMERGKGLEPMYRYYYNATSNKCEEFVYYGGVEENLNRFFTFDQCMDACFKIEEDARTLNDFNQEDCLLEMDEGFGRAGLRRYHYNATLKQCIEFTFGGEEGNRNRFDTEEECLDACFLKSEESPSARTHRRMDCELEVQMVDSCRLTPHMHRVARCTAIPFWGSTPSACVNAGCCWHHSMRICYQYSPRSVRGEFCHILEESRNSFIGVAHFQSPIRTNHGWVGYLSFTKPNTGSFCVLKQNFTPKITIGGRFMKDRGILLEERSRIPGGYRTDFLFTGTFGQTSINPRICAGEVLLGRSRSESTVRKNT